MCHQCRNESVAAAVPPHPRVGRAVCCLSLVVTLCAMAPITLSWPCEPRLSTSLAGSCCLYSVRWCPIHKAVPPCPNVPCVSLCMTPVACSRYVFATCAEGRSATMVLSACLPRTAEVPGVSAPRSAASMEAVWAPYLSVAPMARIMTTSASFEDMPAGIRNTWRSNLWVNAALMLPLTPFFFPFPPSLPVASAFPKLAEYNNKTLTHPGVQSSAVLTQHTP
ncbi:hypothetical protein E2C01_046807 [Portunus trituberculatus]|uniref:Uncharacterized protein n=1 Tax=Portunus trituberculatus TaxID=210409 RepID=A0A5B7G630_PORTR|nr:hypothetical protein [Portunus trituberculatus]